MSPFAGTAFAALAIAAFAPSTASGTDPSAAIAISEHGLDYAAAIALPVVVERLHSMKVGDVSTHEDGFDIQVTKIKCSTIGVDDLELSPGSHGCSEAYPFRCQNGECHSQCSRVYGGEVETGTVGLSATGITAHCTAKFAYKFASWPHLPKGEGNVLLDVSKSTHADVDLELAASGGVPELKVSRCKTAVNIANLRFGDHAHNVMETILNRFTGHLKPVIGSAIAGPVCDAVKDAVKDQANPALATFSPSIEVPLPSPLEMDFSLLRVASSASKPAYLSFMLRAAASGAPAPAKALVLPSHDAAVTNKMAELLLLPYAFTSLAAEMVAAGEAFAVLKAEDIPESIGIPLTTDTFADLAPGMATKWPGIHNVQIKLSLVKAPALQVAGGEISFKAPLRIDFSVETTVSAAASASMVAPPVVAPVFSLACSLEGGVGSVRVEDGKLKGELENVAMSPLVLAENESDGDVDVANLGMLMQYVVIPQATSAANGVLKSGVVLPTIGGLSLVNAEVKLDGPFLRIATDVEYTPPPPPPPPAAADKKAAAVLLRHDNDDEVALAAK